MNKPSGCRNHAKEKYADSLPFGITWPLLLIKSNVNIKQNEKKKKKNNKKKQSDTFSL